MIDTLRALMSSGRIEHGRMRAQLIAIVSLFLDAGGAAGDRTSAPMSAPPMWPQHSLASWSSPVLPTSGLRRRACSTSFWMASGRVRRVTFHDMPLTLRVKGMS